jgi:hypothetical protein
MAVRELTVFIKAVPELAIELCSKALESQGFKKLNLDSDRMNLSAQKRAVGQWTSDHIQVSITPSTGGCRVHAQCESTAQSLTSLARHPSDVLLSKFSTGLSSLISLADAPDVSAQQNETRTGLPPTSIADELKKFADLRESGVISEEEFAQQKTKLLGEDRD